MVILDPDRDGCRVYSNMMVSYIKGHPAEVCRIILPRVCCGIDHFGRPNQVITIGITSNGVCDYYLDIFRSMDLQYFVEIPNKHIECVLPVLCSNDCQGNTR